MLRGPARVELERGLEITDRSLAVREELEDSDPDRMAEHPEQLRLTHVHRVGTNMRGRRRRRRCTLLRLPAWGHRRS
jgi:hypothetical protein